MDDVAIICMVCGRKIEVVWHRPVYSQPLFNAAMDEEDGESEFNERNLWPEIKCDCARKSLWGKPVISRKDLKLNQDTEFYALWGKEN